MFHDIPQNITHCNDGTKSWSGGGKVYPVLASLRRGTIGIPTQINPNTITTGKPNSANPLESLLIKVLWSDNIHYVN